MNGAGTRDTTVWQEVRRRRVLKVMASYLAVAYAGFEVVQHMVPEGSAPDWIRRVILGGLVLGFPVAVVLAWTYDITKGGVVRTPQEFGSEAPPEPTRHGWKVVMVVAVLVGAIVHLTSR